MSTQTLLVFVGITVLLALVFWWVTAETLTRIGKDADEEATHPERPAHRTRRWGRF